MALPIATPPSALVTALSPNAIEPSFTALLLVPMAVPSPVPTTLSTANVVVIPATLNAVTPKIAAIAAKRFTFC